MQIDRSRRHHVNSFSSDNLFDRGLLRSRDNGNSMTTMSSTLLMIPSSPPTTACSPNGGVGGLNFIEHTVSKMDTLAGVAIKYGVEVADIKRMNGLVTDLQMFALKSLQIPLPGRHPPSAVLSNGSVIPGENGLDQTPPRRRSEVIESLQSLRSKSPKQKVSPAMSCLQGYYGLKPPNPKHPEESTEMAVYSTNRAQYLEDGVVLPKSSAFPDQQNLHRKSRSLINGFSKDELAQDVPVTDVVRDGDGDKSNEKSVRRRQKAETDIGFCTPEKLLKEDSSGGSGFSVKTGKGLNLRPKTTNRIALPADTDSSWLKPVPVGLGETLATNIGIFDGFRKSSSTSNLQDQERNGSSSIWKTSKWSLKPDLQALSAATIARPIFDGLPKPVTGRRNKAALD